MADGEGRADYGVDAPYVPVLQGVAAALLIAGGVLQKAPPMVVIGLVMAAAAAAFVHTTRRGKFVLWDEMLDGLDLQGDEHLLDMGCGRGAVTISAARRLPRGRVTGIDLWSRADQSGNSEEATGRNAHLEGVADRVAIRTGDMTALPFGPSAFDVVVSSLAMHNISTAGERRTAVDEAVRVLRPGGKLAIVDIRATAEYTKRLQELGMADVARRGLGWRGWYGGPWMASSAVSANKPADAPA